MNLHRIRLRKPWQCEALAEGVLWRRKFGCPSALGPEDMVWLCIDGALPGGTVALNGEELGWLSGPTALGRHDVTARLRPRNELRIAVAGVVAPAQSPCEPPIDVFLEIRSR